jgi:hypothetical protein
MEAALAHGVQHVEAQGDSKLVVMQVNGKWKVKHQLLKPLHQQALSYIDRFQTFSISHIYRDVNGEADALANEGVDSGAQPLSWPANAINSTDQGGLHALKHPADSPAVADPSGGTALLEGTTLHTLQSVTLVSRGQGCDASLVGEDAEVLPGKGGWRTVVLLSGPRKGQRQRWRSNWWQQV